MKSGGHGLQDRQESRGWGEMFSTKSAALVAGAHILKHLITEVVERYAAWSCFFLFRNLPSCRLGGSGGTGSGCPSNRNRGRRALQPLAQPAGGVHRDLSGLGHGAYGVRHAVVEEIRPEKTRQDALGVSFSEREAFCERRQRCVVLRAGRPTGAQNGGKKT